ncbi:thioredoxin family protein [Candidatus Micrarchaeota archaeon]|nr:thioredoxin family protein [Candidatus Micrarchaeota archaeon]MBU2476434.1 thioredoxin family protein [Candidatus Micrarchaeota archaeon]
MKHLIIGLVLFVLISGCLANTVQQENKNTGNVQIKQDDLTGNDSTTTDDLGTKETAEIKTFSAKDGSACLEDGKPVIRLFSTTWCPHCVWIKDTFDSVVKEYVDSGKIIAYHWELDTGDNTLTEEVETVVPDSETAIYREFNPKATIPTFVFGCKYSRVGNGFESSKDLVSEEKEFKAVIETLLGN